MNNLKRLAVVVAIIAIAALVGGSFGGSEILQRGIIVGIGIDVADDENELQVTAEVISPGNGSEQIGTFSKTITVTANGIADSIKVIAENIGKEASLGQCLILVFGEKYFSERNFFDTIDYFINSDSFRESAIVCCSRGSAKDLFAKGDALSQSVSLALSAKLVDQAEKVGIATNNLLDFTRSQRELSKSGYLNVVSYVPSENTDEADPENPQGYFSYGEIAVFKNHELNGVLSRDESKAFSLLKEKALGDSFVSNASGKLLTLNVNDKSISNKYKDGEITIEVKLSVNLARTDSANESGAFTYKEPKSIPSETLDDVKGQAERMIEAFLKKQMADNFDIVDLHETIRQKQGRSNALSDLPTRDIPVKFTVEIEEK